MTFVVDSTYNPVFTLFSSDLICFDFCYRCLDCQQSSISYFFFDLIYRWMCYFHLIWTFVKLFHFWSNVILRLFYIQYFFIQLSFKYKIITFLKRSSRTEKNQKITPNSDPFPQKTFQVLWKIIFCEPPWLKIKGWNNRKK